MSIFHTLQSNNKAWGNRRNIPEFIFFLKLNYAQKLSMLPLANHFPSVVGFYRENQSS